MLSAVMPSVVMLSAVMPSVIMLSTAMPGVVMLIVMAPSSVFDFCLFCFKFASPLFVNQTKLFTS